MSTFLADLAFQQQFQGSGEVSPIVWICYLAIIIVFIIASWRLFEKAGEPGWYAIVPILSTIILLKIAGKPWWWIVLLLIPFVNFIILIILYLDLAKAFGKSTLFGVGLILLSPIFFLILAFDDSEYIGV